MPPKPKVLVCFEGLPLPCFPRTYSTHGFPPSGTCHCLSPQGFSRWHASQSEVMLCPEGFSLP